MQLGNIPHSPGVWCAFFLFESFEPRSLFVFLSQLQPITAFRGQKWNEFSCHPFENILLAHNSAQYPVA